jgi:hypothetical protein
METKAGSFYHISQSQINKKSLAVLVRKPARLHFIKYGLCFTIYATVPGATN